MHCFCYGKYLTHPQSYKTIKFTQYNAKDEREICRAWADATNRQLTLKYLTTVFILLLNNGTRKLYLFITQKQSAHTRSEESMQAFTKFTFMKWKNMCVIMFFVNFNFQGKEGFEFVASLES